MAIALSQKRSKNNKKHQVISNNNSNREEGKDETSNNNNSNNNSNNSNSMASSAVTYNATGNGGAVRRIRTPAPHDVLSGRGGSVNAHPGNIQFRDWVSVRKDHYNLANSKQDKADICKEVIQQVVDLGGRFLVKETPNSQWWIELDEDRVMAKTSQALREGAPKIREAHHRTTGDEDRHGGKRPRARRPAKRTLDDVQIGSVPSATLLIAKQPNQQQQQQQHLPNNDAKRVRVEYKGQAVLPSESTPPLTSMPAPTFLQQQQQQQRDIELMPAPEQFPSMPLPRRLSAGFPNGNNSNTNSNSQITTTNNNNNLTRSHSLALSDFYSPDDLDNNYGEFVNPFEDESELLGRKSGSSSSSTSAAVAGTTGALPRISSFGLAASLPPPPKPGFLRESSTASSGSDMAGLGALFRSSDSCSSNNNNNNNRSNGNGNTGTAPPTLGAFFREQSSGKSSDASGASGTAVRVMMMNSRSSSSNLSSRSLNSVLSDLPDARHQPTDFAEGMAMIYDALHPADFDEEHCGGGGCDDESSSSSMRTMMIPPPPPPMTMTAAPGAATTSAFRLSSCFRRNGISTRVVDDGRQ